jgi:hypothetical protein
LYKKFGKKNEAGAPNDTIPLPAGGGGTTSTTFPLKTGSNNADVKALQTALNKYLTKMKSTIAQLATDGNFGAKTLAAWQYFAKIVNATGSLQLNLNEVTKDGYNRLLFSIT